MSDVPAVRSSLSLLDQLQQAGGITATALVLPPDLPYDQYTAIAHCIAEADTEVKRRDDQLQWLTGDLANYGETVYGEEFTQAIAEAGFKPQTVPGVQAPCGDAPLAYLATLKDSSELSYWRARVIVGDNDEDWWWTGSRNKNGYGNARRTTANRFTWQLFFGEIPSHLAVCHTCDQPPCVNPAHLFLGTHSDNALDAMNKGRRRTSSDDRNCPNGHALAGDNVYFYNGARQCKLCRARHDKKYKESILVETFCIDCGAMRMEPPKRRAQRCRPCSARNMVAIRMSRRKQVGN